VQNLSSSEVASISMVFFNQDGTTGGSATDSIDANDSNTYCPLAAVSEGFDGSAVISSDQPISAIVNVSGNGGDHGASYIGSNSGSTSVNLPLVMKNNYGIYTWFNVQNAGSSDASVDIGYAGTACTESATIKPGASATFDQSTNGCLGASYVGAATITSTIDVVVAAMQVTDGDFGLSQNLLSYTGFTSSYITPTMPLFSNGFYSSLSSIAMQNTGAVSTDVTVTFTPGDSFPGATCTETHSIAPGQMQTFGYPTFPSACETDAGGAGSAAFVGSASVTTNSAQMPLVAIVNQITQGAPNAAAYSAFDPDAATTIVSMPLIMDRVYGIFTGFAVMNVGDGPTDITCTFSDTAYTVSDTGVLPGEAIIAVQVNAIAASYVGAGTCTSTGEPIVAVVNETNTGSVIPGVEDGLFTYEGTNH
jgi:hypothetical protein